MREEKLTTEQRAAKLRQAEAERKPIPCYSADPEFTIEEARRVQFLNKEHVLAQGQTLTGYKVGLTSHEAQKQFGVFQPDFGHLFSSMVISNGGTLRAKELIQSKVEGEIAFVLKEDLKGPGLALSDVAEAVAGAVAAIEIVDCRFEGWKIKHVDLVADNGASARYVLGSKVVPLDTLDLPLLGMAFSLNGEVVLTGAGAACLENPLEAVRLLANELGALGHTLKAGQVILSGALTAMLPVKPGESYECEFRYLGKVGFRCV